MYFTIRSTQILTLSIILCSRNRKAPKKFTLSILETGCFHQQVKWWGGICPLVPIRLKVSQTLRIPWPNRWTGVSHHLTWGQREIQFGKLIIDLLHILIWIFICIYSVLNTRFSLGLKWLIRKKYYLLILFNLCSSCGLQDRYVYYSCKLRTQWTDTKMYYFTFWHSMKMWGKNSACDKFSVWFICITYLKYFQD